MSCPAHGEKPNPNCWTCLKRKPAPPPREPESKGECEHFFARWDHNLCAHCGKAHGAPGPRDEALWLAEEELGRIRLEPCVQWDNPLEVHTREGCGGCVPCRSNTRRLAALAAIQKLKP